MPVSHVTSHSTHQAANDYRNICPPRGPLRAQTYSAVYVPALLQAAGLLSSQANTAWSAHPTAGLWWPRVINALVTAAPQDPWTLHAAILQEVQARLADAEASGSHADLLRAASTNAQDNAAAERIREAASSNPQHLSIAATVPLVVDHTFYIPAGAQEAILRHFISWENKVRVISKRSQAPCATKSASLDNSNCTNSSIPSAHSGQQQPHQLQQHFQLHLQKYQCQQRHQHHRNLLNH